MGDISDKANDKIGQTVGSVATNKGLRLEGRLQSRVEGAIKRKRRLVNGETSTDMDVQRSKLRRLLWILQLLSSSS